MRTTPIQAAGERRSPRSRVPRIATRTTLSLSIGATRAASQSFSARKSQSHDAAVATPERTRKAHVRAGTVQSCAPAR
jgi:hypothetical protein